MIKVPQERNKRVRWLEPVEAQRLIEAGVPLSALQEMGGWESIEMVRRYAHMSPNHLTEHARKIDDMIGTNDTNLTLLENEGEKKA